MSNFTEISVKLPTKTHGYMLSEELIYEIGYKGSGKEIRVPKGTETDFASLPWMVTFFWRKDDPRWIKSSIIHDYLWSQAKTLEEYQKANEIFFEAMLVEGAPRWIASLFLIAVSFSKYFYFIFIKKSI